MNVLCMVDACVGLDIGELVLEGVAVEFDDHLGQGFVFAQGETSGEHGVAGDPDKVWGLRCDCGVRV